MDRENMMEGCGVEGICLFGSFEAWGKRMDEEIALNGERICKKTVWTSYGWSCQEKGWI